MSKKCDYCGKKMDIGKGCTLKRYDDVKGKRIPWDQDYPCHDCNVTQGQLHHPGCDMERCPQCKGQAISCDCHLGEVKP